MSHLRLLPYGMMVMAAVAGGAGAAENEPVGEAPVVSLALFKNGVASVMREVRPPAADAFLLVDKIEPAHGTLWCTAGDNFRLKTVTRTFEKTLDTPPLNDICQAYDGCKVVVTFLAATSNALASSTAKGDGFLVLLSAGEGKIPTEITGTVVNPAAPEQSKTFSREYEENRWGWHPSYNDNSNRLRNVTPASTHLTLRLESGQRVAIPTGLIASIRSETINTTAQEVREVWRVEGAQKPFVMGYLAKGAAWAPAYRLNLISGTKLSIVMSAIIRNEMAPFKDAEVNLISGFPNIEFANRTSLIVPGSTLASFFEGLSRPQGSGRNTITSQSMMKVTLNSGSGDYDLPAVPSEESSMDIHYRSIGKLSMDVGETLYLQLEQAEVVPYERVTEWKIPDRRDVYGRFVNNEGDIGEFWDMLCFRNPFKSPITTAPVEIADGAKLLGQSTVTWVNPGQGASVKVTKALSVVGSFNETEVDQQRPFVDWGGNRYRNPDVTGEFRVKNYRGDSAKISVRLQVSGEFLSASLDPTDRRILEAGAYAANKRQEMVWTLTLAPGAEQIVTYRYSILVRH